MEATIKKVAEIVSLYSVMVGGHLSNQNLSPEEQMAGIIAAGDLVKKATTLTVARLCEKHNVSPSWTLKDEDITRTAEQYVERMIGNG